MILGLFVPLWLSFCGIQSVPVTSRNEATYAETISRIREQSLGLPDERVGEILGKWSPESSGNPEELGSYFEGDILTLPEESGRNGINGSYFRWHDGIIPYEIEEGAFNETEVQSILAAMEDYHSKTCLRFVEYDGNQTDYISIQGENTGCWSGVGRLGGRQRVNLQPPNCLWRFGVIIHELMHTVGFYHEQSRSDRNDYVTINWENVDPTKFYNFLTSPNSYAYGVYYDYGSVMHYSEDSFSINGNNTIDTKPPGIPIGQRIGFSAIDLDKINLMYNCTV